jgi:hypothetical protein
MLIFNAVMWLAYLLPRDEDRSAFSWRLHHTYIQIHCMYTFIVLTEIVWMLFLYQVVVAWKRRIWFVASCMYLFDFPLSPQCSVPFD